MYINQDEDQYVIIKFWEEFDCCLNVRISLLPNCIVPSLNMRNVFFFFLYFSLLHLLLVTYLRSIDPLFKMAERSKMARDVAPRSCQAAPPFTRYAIGSRTWLAAPDSRVSVSLHQPDGENWKKFPVVSLDDYQHQLRIGNWNDVTRVLGWWTKNCRHLFFFLSLVYTL